MNVFILWKLVGEMRRSVESGEEEEEEEGAGGLRIECGGCLGRVLGRLFWFVDR
jgi:hypothetical protein